jgi:outer membrane lipopolysaccharide assembly protein LptE/RlpB
MRLGLVAVLQCLLLLQACSENSFHLRKNVKLAPQYQQLEIENLSEDSNFKKAFQFALEEANGSLL